MQIKEPSIYELKEEIEDLKNQVFYLTSLLKFHNLYEVPSKYKKAFPREFENPFYEIKDIKKNPKFKTIPLNAGSSRNWPSLDEMPDDKEIKESKQRMWEYYQQSLNNKGD